MKQFLKMVLASTIGVIAGFYVLAVIPAVVDYKQEHFVNHDVSEI